MPSTFAAIRQEIPTAAQHWSVHCRFLLSGCNLAIELDGDGHFTEGGAEADAVRTEFLNKKGVRVLRFENQEIFTALEIVLAEIERNLIS